MALRLDRIRQGMSREYPIETRLRFLSRAHQVVRMDELSVIRDARNEGVTWRAIGDALGITESAARKRYVGKGIE